MTAPPTAFMGGVRPPPQRATPTMSSGSWDPKAWGIGPGYGAGVSAALASIPTTAGPNFGAMYSGGAGAGIQMQNPYANLIGGDYDVQGMESRMNATLGRARGDFQSQLRQALIDLGVVDKSKLGNLGGYIDAATIQKAAENKYSRNAQIEQQVQSQRAQSEAALAARGLLSSGQLATESERSIAQGEQGRYQALRDFLSGGQQGLTQIADVQDQLAGQLASARYEAAQRAAEMQMYANMWDQQYGQPAPAPVSLWTGPQASPFVYAPSGNPPSQYGYNPDPTHPYW